MRPFQVCGPVLIEPSQNTCSRGSSAISTIQELLEEIALSQGAHRDREMGHALVGSEGFGELNEVLSLCHAAI